MVLTAVLIKNKTTHNTNNDTRIPLVFHVDTGETEEEEEGGEVELSYRFSFFLSSLNTSYYHLHYQA